jgi:hypothetical protein
MRSPEHHCSAGEQVDSLFSGSRDEFSQPTIGSRRSGNQHTAADADAVAIDLQCRSLAIGEYDARVFVDDDNRARHGIEAVHDRGSFVRGRPEAVVKLKRATEVRDEPRQEPHFGFPELLIAFSSQNADPGKVGPAERAMLTILVRSNGNMKSL